jgi:carboxymethylenebutenolidase
MFDGQVATTVEQAEQQTRTADGEHTMQKVRNALKFLLAQKGVEKQSVGVIGFSFGAYYALRLSGIEPEHVCAVVVFYGTGDGEFGQAQARYMGHFAENDPYEPAENIEWLENALTTAGRSVEFYRYPRVGHWFFESDRVDAYDQPAAQLAWVRTLNFLQSSLSSPSHL